MIENSGWTLEQLKDVVEEAIKLGYWITFRGAAEALGEVERYSELGNILRRADDPQPWMAALIYSNVIRDTYYAVPLVAAAGEVFDSREFVARNNLAYLRDELDDEGRWARRIIDPTDVIDFGGHKQSFGFTQTVELERELRSANLELDSVRRVDPLPLEELERRYGEGVSKYRKHQAKLRKLSFQYARTTHQGVACLVCGFDDEVLLEAAHVIPDAHGGEASVKNIIILCPTHHRAFDRHYFDVDPTSWPDWKITTTVQNVDFATVWINRKVE